MSGGGVHYTDGVVHDISGGFYDAGVGVHDTCGVSMMQVKSSMTKVEVSRHGWRVYDTARSDISGQVDDKV